MYSVEEMREALAPTFRVDAELRQDGLGHRLLARDAADRPMMVTVLSAPLARQMSPEAFVNSLRQTMVVRHPALLPMEDTGRTGGGIIYFATPFPDGPSAEDRLRDRGAVSAADAARIGRQALGGLGALHVAGLVHGRLSARALYLTEGGAMVADHGVYQALISAGAPGPAIIAAYGSYSHASPEQQRGELADARSDVYSLGATLYELVTGKAPFGGRTTSATLVTVLSDEPGETVGGAQMPGYVSRALLRAIEKDPDDRWQTADAFSRALSDSDAEPGADQRGRGCLPASASAIAAGLVVGWLLH